MPLVGPPSLHAAVLRGGTGTSTYADHCRLEIERRTVPGETEEQVLAEIRAITDALAAEDATFRATVRAMLTRGSFEVDRNAPIVSAVLGAATTVLGAKPEVDRRAILDGRRAAVRRGHRHGRHRAGRRRRARARGMG